jgi:hypothetical protein
MKLEGYKVSLNRRNNRVDCMSARSEPSSLSEAGISGHKIDETNSMSSLLDHPQYVESTEQLSDDQNDLSYNSNDMIDYDDSSQGSFEEEKEAPLKPGNKTTKIDFKSLTFNQRQALWCNEIDRLIEISKFFDKFEDSVSISTAQTEDKDHPQAAA